jgi:hypothetical protein
LSHSLFAPWTTAVAALTWLCFLAVAINRRKRDRLFFFAVTWFVAGHLLESTIAPLDLVYEHRNYLPAVGLLCWVLSHIFSISSIYRVPARILALGIILVLGAITAYRAWQWSDPITLAVIEARHHPQSARARYENGRIHFRLYLDDKRDQDLALARDELAAAARLDSEPFMPLSGLVTSYLIAREPVPEVLLERLQYDLKTSSPTQRRLSTLAILIDCQMLRKCEIAPAVIVAVAGAILGNKQLTATNKADTLEWLAVYYAMTLNDYTAGRRVAEEAMRTVPSDWKYRLRVVEVMLGQKDRTAALQTAMGLPKSLGFLQRYSEPAVENRLNRVWKTLRS